MTSGEDAIEQAASSEIPVVVLNLELPGMSASETLRALRAVASPPEVVLTAGQGSIESVAEAARFGAFDFVPQPFELKQLGEVLRAAHNQALRRRKTQHLERALKPHKLFPEIVGTSAGIQGALAVIQKAAPTHSPVLIQRESGTGKELVARALHACSPRADAPLTIVDCGALQDTLLESELFGHERGAFTGAFGLKHGLFETANTGTLFLDEIGEMSPVTQVKVLRALQSGEFRRVGSNRHIRADIRVIAATNRDLREEVTCGRFREDLYYRLAVIEIHVPPLRERIEDIPLLVEHFLRQSAYDERPRLRITKEAMDHLKAYSWPGNIRELRNCIERLSVLADDQLVTVESLPASLVKPPLTMEPSDAVVDLTLQEVARRHIFRTLERHQWNKKRAAAILGIDTKTLYNKLRSYGITMSGREDEDPHTRSRSAKSHPKAMA